MPSLLKSAIRPQTLLYSADKISVLIGRLWNLGQKTVGDTLEAWPDCRQFWSDFSWNWHRAKNGSYKWHWVIKRACLLIEQNCNLQSLSWAAMESKGSSALWWMEANGTLRMGEPHLFVSALWVWMFSHLNLCPSWHSKWLFCRYS